MFMVDGQEAGLGPGDHDCGESLAARQTTEWGRREQEDEEGRKATAPHNFGVPGLSATDITPTRHGTPSAGAGGHEMFMGDDREAGLGLGDQGCGASAAARQAPEKESFMATEHSDYHLDAHMSDRGHISGTPLFGGG